MELRIIWSGAEIRIWNILSCFEMMKYLNNSKALMGIKFKRFLIIFTYSLMILQSAEVGIISITNDNKYYNIE